MTTLNSTSPLVGRQKELAQLRSALSDSMSGVGRIVLLGGEAGIGKTRLADELTTEAQGQSCLTLRGASHERAGAPPYWPWIQVVREAIKSMDKSFVESATQTAGNYVASVFPDLAAFVGEFDANAQEDSAVAKFKSLDAATVFLISLSSQRPLTIVLEDLHWSDQATLDLLEFLTDLIRNEHILVVGTFRDIETDENHPLSRTIVSLNRGQSFSRIPIRGLKEDDSRHLIRTTAGQGLQPELVEAVRERTQGNPFFITEIVNELKAFDDEGAGNKASNGQPFRIPDTVRAAFSRRLIRQTPEAIRVLTLGAFVDRDFDFPEIEHLDPELTSESIATSLSEATDAGILTRVSTSTLLFRFAHPLMPDVLRSGLAPVEAAQMHLQLATRLESWYGTDSRDHVAEIAEHLMLAGPLGNRVKTATYLVSAGERFITANSFVDAKNCFEEALSRLGGAGADLELLARAHIGAGRATPHSTFQTVEFQGAWDHLAIAFELFLKLGLIDSALEAVSHNVPFRFIKEASDVLEKAVGIAEDGSPRLGRLLARYAIAQREERADFEGARNSLTRANQLAIDAGDRTLLAFVKLHSAQHAVSEMDSERALAESDMAEALAEELGELNITSRLPFYKAKVLIQYGQTEQVDQVLVNGIAAAHRLRLGNWADTAQNMKFQFELIKGNFESAIEYLESTHWMTHSEQTVSMLQSCVEYEIGAVAPLSWFDPNDYSYVEHIDTRDLVIRAVDRASITEDVTSLARSIPAPQGQRHEMMPESIDKWVRDRATLALQIGNPGAILKLYDELVKSPRPFVFSTGSTGRLLGRLATTMGRDESAQVHFEHALSFSRSAGYRTEFVLTCYYFAKMLFERSGPDDGQRAGRLVEEGSRLATSIGMQSMISQLMGLNSSVSQSHQSTSTVHRLTGRQTEVLSLVAQGKTNAEIAIALNITINTVARHVADIYDRVPATNRVELAAYSHEIGIA